MKKLLPTLLILTTLLINSLWADDGKTTTSTGKKPAAAKSTDTDPWVLYDGKLRFSAQERMRLEFRDNNFDFDSTRDPVTDDTFLLQRFRIGLTAQPAPGMTVSFEGQDSREIGSRRDNLPGVLGAEGDDEFDLRQAWILLADPKVFPTSLKAGRMIWKYGDERLIGDFDWNNLGRTFDGVVAHTEIGKSWLDVFFGSPVFFKPGEFNVGDGHDRMGGIYYSTPEWLEQTTELYLLYRNHGNSVNNGQAQEICTPGVRFKSVPKKYGPWDYEMELAGQAGSIRSGTRSLDHYAFASHIQGSYTWHDLACKPSVGALYDYGSGDSDPNDSQNTSFQNMFPTNHKFYGAMDLFSWRNIHDLGFSLACKPIEAVNLKLDIHSFWLPETADAWYRANANTTIRAASAERNVDDHVGEEIDLTAQWKINRFVTATGGYSHFFTGGFASATGTSSDADFGFLQLTAGF